MLVQVYFASYLSYGPYINMNQRGNATAVMGKVKGSRSLEDQE